MSTNSAILRRTAVLCLLWWFSASAGAQIRGSNIVVEVNPDHADWNYKTGETAVFTARVLKSSTLVKDAVIDYEAGEVMYPDIKKEGVRLPDGVFTLKARMDKPGFYRLKVATLIGGRRYEGLCTVAFSPEEIRPVTVCPSDFDSFWRETVSEARRVPLDSRRRLLAERSSDKVSVYEVSFQNIAAGSRTYGILAIPVKEGRYPALLRVPGAGVRPYEGDTYTAPEGAVTLEIGIHGIPVTMDQSIYDRLALGALNGYWRYGAYSRDESYYKRVIIGCVRAVDFIAALDEWDGKTLGVGGSSQGGLLSIATAALDSRVTFFTAVHDAMCDMSASLKRQACGWPHPFYGQKEPDMREVEASRYYDGVNFARLARCPAWFSFGYNDEVVPPTAAYATYNIYEGEKTLSVYQQTGHFWYQEQWDEWLDYIRRHMGLMEQ